MYCPEYTRVSARTATGAVVHGRESVNFFSVYFCDGRVRGERDEQKKLTKTREERGAQREENFHAFRVSVALPGRELGRGKLSVKRSQLFLHELVLFLRSQE